MPGRESISYADPGPAPVVAAVEAGPAREIDAARNRSGDQRPRRRGPGGRRHGAPAISVVAEEGGRAGNERTPSVGVESRGECRPRQDVWRLDLPIAPAISRAPHPAVGTQQQMVRLLRADRERERAADE